MLHDICPQSQSQAVDIDERDPAEAMYPRVLEPLELAAVPPWELVAWRRRVLTLGINQLTRCNVFLFA